MNSGKSWNFKKNGKEPYHATSEVCLVI
jgi:hypothetical protein